MKNKILVSYILIAVAIIIIFCVTIYVVKSRQYNNCLASGGTKYSNSYAPLKCELNGRIYNDPKSVLHMIIYNTNQ